MKLSIIIPAYNQELYIKDCLDSIYCQNINEENLEVIVVNDGSTDRTEEILKQYAGFHNNITIIKQENQGLSASRNNGTKLATGDLVWYVDSDDTITKDSISSIFHYFQKYPNSDFLLFDSYHHDFKNDTIKYNKSVVGTHLGSNRKERKIYEHPQKGQKGIAKLDSYVVWKLVLKHSFIKENDLSFMKGLLHEDDEWTLRVFFLAKEMCYIPHPIYIYKLLRPGSLTDSYINKKINTASVESVLKTIENWKTFGNKHIKKRSDATFLYQAICYKLCSILDNKDDIKSLNMDIDIHALEKECSKYFWKSQDFYNISFLYSIRYFCTIYFPSLKKYTNLSTWKNMIR